MPKVKIELDHNGIRELLLSDDIENECKRLADEAKNKLGDGYEVTSMKGKNRVNASIKAESASARRENLKNNSIIKAVFGQ